MSTLIIKYAIDLKTQKAVYINNVPNGLACGCHCAKCGEKMIAVQGKSANHKEWHFRHYIESNCTGGQETAIHKASKQIILENFQIAIPNENLIYSNPRQEEKLISIIPDVSVIANEQNVYFEIAVTHPVDSTKEMFYKKGKYKCIEIDLRDILYNITPSELKELVLKTARRTKISWDTVIDDNQIIHRQSWYERNFEAPVFAIFFIFLLFVGYRMVKKIRR